MHGCVVTMAFPVLEGSNSISEPKSFHQLTQQPILHGRAHEIAKHTVKDNYSISGQRSFHQLTQEPILHSTASTMCALMESTPFEPYIILYKGAGRGVGFCLSTRGPSIVQGPTFQTGPAAVRYSKGYSKGSRRGHTVPREAKW